MIEIKGWHPNAQTRLLRDWYSPTPEEEEELETRRRYEEYPEDQENDCE